MEPATVPPVATPARPARRWYLRVALVAAVLSLLLSPITAVWAVAVGVPLVLAGALVARRWWVGRVALAVGAGVLAGVVPYFGLAAILAA